MGRSTGKTFNFGRDSRLIGAITEPSGAAAPEIGMVAWGLGLAELKAARRLAQLGLASLQIRRQDVQRGAVGHDAVDVFREAIDELNARRGSEQFILMGNCAAGSVSLNAAITEERVVGLILTNPNVGQALSYLPSLRRKLVRWRAWRRVLTGRANFALHLKRLFKLGSDGIMGPQTVRAAVRARARVNTELPRDLAAALATLATRGVRTLIVCSESDASLDYFRTVYGGDLSGLRALPNVTIEILGAGAHVVSKDESASAALEDIVFRWASTSGVIPSASLQAPGNALAS